MSNQQFDLLKEQGSVLGHPSGLFVLFFTEMWERFSYYGMRALLVLFLVQAIDVTNPGWGWERENALALFGTYVLLVYLTPIMGGYIADNFTGSRMAIIIGAFLMTLGHASMAMDTPFFLYVGLGLLIVGTGFFKPNMVSTISKMYEKHPEKKDGAFTIFYMGVNGGAFLGIMLCGYLGEKVGWSWGFGLAGIFMFLGMLQFWLATPIFGDIGDKPKPKKEKEVVVQEGVKLNPFTLLDKVLIIVFAVLAILWIFDNPMSKIAGISIIPGGETAANSVILTAIGIFVVILLSRLLRYSPGEMKRLGAVAIIAFFTIFFWASFEQAAGSMAIFAKDYTARALSGDTANIFKVIDTVVTVVPLLIITWVLFRLFKETISRITLSNVILGISFVVIWGIVIYKLNREFSNTETEVPATWFAILNSLFIIMFAPLFSKLWETKFNPPPAVKYGLGFFLLGTGFLFLVIGTSGVAKGALTAQVSMFWLIMAYFFHTLGELCVAPVGLSFVSKLVPPRMIAFLFGVWYLAIATGNKLAHTAGGMIDRITAEYSLSSFFLIFTIVPFAAGLLIIALNPVLKKLMQEVK